VRLDDRQIFVVFDVRHFRFELPSVGAVVANGCRRFGETLLPSLRVLATNLKEMIKKTV
jgi:hypothetical protein